jgi:hypothetical protein
MYLSLFYRVQDLEKLIVCQLVKKFPASLEPKCSLNQLIQIHIFTSRFSKIHFDILPSTSESPKFQTYVKQQVKL